MARRQILRVIYSWKNVFSEDTLYTTALDGKPHQALAKNRCETLEASSQTSLLCWIFCALERKANRSVCQHKNKPRPNSYSVVAALSFLFVFLCTKNQPGSAPLDLKESAPEICIQGSARADRLRLYNNMRACAWITISHPVEPCVSFSSG